MCIKSLQFTSICTIVFLGFGLQRANAQCTSNAECQNGGVCSGGQCVSSSTQPAPPAAQPAPTAAQPAPPAAQPAPPAAYPAPPSISSSSVYQAPQTTVEHPDKGWALGAGILGMINAATIGGLSSAAMNLAANDPSASVSDYRPAGTALFVTVGLLNAAGGPTVFMGSYSARKTAASIRGVRGLRVTGWIFYGLQIAALSSDGILLATDQNMAPLFVALHGILGSLSQAFFAIDAFVAASQAKRAMAAASADNEAPRKKQAATFYPLVAPVYAPNGTIGGLNLGMGASF